VPGGHDDANLLRPAFGESKLARAFLGCVVSRPPALCAKTLNAGTRSNHCSLDLVADALLRKDLEFLNGTWVDSLGQATARAPQPGREDGR
jgi:hypothetical protein